MLLQIIVRSKGNEFLVIAKGNDPITGALTRFDIIDRFATKELAEKKADLLTHILKKCAEVHEKQLVGAI